MITLHYQLAFEKEEDKKELLGLMRRFSFCYRYAYNKLLEQGERKKLEKYLQEIFNLNSRYVDDVIFKTHIPINFYQEREQNPNKLGFGSRSLYEKLKKKHLNGKERKELEETWRERRKACLYSRGDESKNGNLNTRIESEKEKALVQLKEEKNTYKKKPIKKKVNKLNKNLKIAQSLYSEPETQQQVCHAPSVNLWRKQMRGLSLWTSYKLWQVIKVALAFPILGKPLNRDLSHLKPVMVEGNVNRIVRRLVLGS